MLYKKLYKLNSDGETVQTWEIHSDNDKYYTISGQLEGKKTTSAPTLVTPKVKRTLEQQIELEMNALIKKKKDNKYVENLSDIQGAEEALDGYSPILAKKWEEQQKKIVFPCAVQPKLDGVRCLITKDGMFSRTRQRITSCQHIWEELKPIFERFPNTRLDGELYSHIFKDDFEKIISAVRKTADKATQEDLELQKKVSFFMYDAPRIVHWNENDGFNKRFQAAATIIASSGFLYVTVLETEFVNNVKQIEDLHDSYIEKGYEGAMIRNLEMPYEGKRTHHLLKMKNFQEEEFEIIGIKEGEGKLAGHAGTLIVKMENGQTFDPKLKGSFERLKWIFENPNEVIGKMATVRYQNLTKYGIPRFCVAKDIRGLKDRSDWL